MNEIQYCVEQQCYDGTWTRVSDFYQDEIMARAARSSAKVLTPTQGFRLIKEARTVVEISGKIISDYDHTFNTDQFGI